MGKNVQITHGAHGPWAPLAMWPIANVAHTPCTPYPLCPYCPCVTVTVLQGWLLRNSNQVAGQRGNRFRSKAETPDNGLGAPNAMLTQWWDPGGSYTAAIHNWAASQVVRRIHTVVLARRYSTTHMLLGSLDQRSVSYGGSAWLG